MANEYAVQPAAPTAVGPVLRISPAEEFADQPAQQLI
jgi:hypothetical protein